MPTFYNIFDLQIYDRATGKAVITTGGNAVVVATGAYAKSTLLNPDSDYVSLANPIAATRGKFRFAIASTGLGLPAVDVFGISPGGYAFRVLNVKPGDVTDVWIDSQKPEQTLILPFSIADAVAATEKDTGFDLVTGMTVMPFPSIDVRTVDSAKTIDIGLLSSESGGDADGFVALGLLTTAGVVQAKLAATATLGALLKETIVADAGTAASRIGYSVGATAVSISFTLSSGTTTAAGYIRLPYLVR